MANEVRKVPERSRYELLVDGELLGIADYREHDGVVVLPHTVIDAAHRGQGLGDVLVEGVLADIRAEGAKVVPACWFVADYVERHVEAADLVA
jgi:predicted GNAT family acetyltransferase